MGSEKLTQTLQTSPPPLQFFSSPKLGGFCIMKKTKPPKALHSHSSPFFPLLPSFFQTLSSRPLNSQTEPNVAGKKSGTSRR